MPSKIATVGVERAAELSADRFDASLILAIHAGISAADAVCVGLGTRKNKESHERAADLLEEVGGHVDEFTHAANRLRALVAGKTAIEYENKRARRQDAEVSVRRCSALVEWAESTLRKAKLLP